MKIPGLPKKKDAHRKASERMMKDLAIFSHWPDAEDKTLLVNDLTSALDSVDYPYDGYAIAKELDTFYWEITADMVSELDFADRFVEEEFTRLITAWVKETGYQLPFKKGDIVTAVWDRKPFNGAVHEIREDGTLLVSLDSIAQEGYGVFGWDAVDMMSKETQQG
jgi:hypothetical protein